MQTFTPKAGRPHLRISRYQQRISEIFLSLISVKSFASSRVRTADLESHSPLLYHRAMQNCCETKLLKTLNKLSLNSQGSQGPENFSKFLRWVPPDFYIKLGNGLFKCSRSVKFMIYYHQKIVRRKLLYVFKLVLQIVLQISSRS